MSKTDFDAVCEDCKRSNIRRMQICGGLGNHCPLNIIDHMLEKQTAT